jgi:pseudouridine synthase
MDPQRQDNADYRDATKGERLQKVLARAGVASRRACEELIEQGVVRVNGQIIDALPAWVDLAKDKVTVKGKPIEGDERKLYLMLYKPRNTVTTADDEAGRRTVLDLIDHPSGNRLYPVGRLDFDTMGLLLLTNDGELANRMTHPSFGVHKTYRAIVKGVLDEPRISAMKRGIYLADRRDGETSGAKRTGDVDIVVVRKERDRTVVDLTLREGRNREVRRLFASIGCPVKKLTRTSMGPLHLKGLRLGEWRELTSTEVAALKRTAFGRRPSGKGKKP